MSVGIPQSFAPTPRARAVGAIALVLAAGGALFLALWAWVLIRLAISEPASVGVCSANGLVVGRIALFISLPLGGGTACLAWRARRWFRTGRVVLILVLARWAFLSGLSLADSLRADGALAAKCPEYEPG